jgi:tRNA-specific 2-thiouridylase
LIFESTSITYLPENGKVVGKHQGAHYFTIGQRKGLNVGGTKEALFIIATDVETNVIYTGQGSQSSWIIQKSIKSEPQKFIGFEKI